MPSAKEEQDDAVAGWAQLCIAAGSKIAAQDKTIDQLREALDVVFHHHADGKCVACFEITQAALAAGK